MAKLHDIQPKTAYWQPDFKGELSTDGVWTATHSFLCRLNDAPELVPKKGSECQEEGFNFITFDSARLENIEAEIAKVTCTYGGTDNATYDFGDDAENDFTYTREIAITTSDRDIKTHPRYAVEGENAISQEDWEHIAAIQEGRLQPIMESINEGIGYGEWQYTHKTNYAEFIPLEGLAFELAIALAKTPSYLDAGLIYRVTKADKNAPADSEYTKVGYKGNPPVGAPNIQGRDWLYIGLQLREENGVFVTTREWRLSGEGGWSDTYYTEAGAKGE